MKREVFIVYEDDSTFQSETIRGNPEETLVKILYEEVRDTIESGYEVADMGIDRVTLKEAKEWSEAFKTESEGVDLAENGWFAYIKDSAGGTLDIYVFQVEGSK